MPTGPAGAAIRREWYEWSAVQGGLVGGCLGIFVSAFLFWPAIAFSVRGLQSPTIVRTRFSAFLSCLAWLLCLAAIAFASALAFVMQDPTEIAFGLTPLFKGLLLAPQFAAGLAALTVLACIIAWRQGYWRLTGRLHYTLVALAGVAFTGFLYYWNLLPFGFSGLK